MAAESSQGLSLRALAKVLGRAPSGLHKLAKAKQIPQLADGTFDLTSVEAALAANIDPARSKGVHQPVHQGVHLVNAPNEHPSDRENTRPAFTSDDALAAVTLIRRIIAEEGGETERDGTVDYASARLAETILKARERDLKIAQRRKELVPLVAVQRHVEKAFIGLRQAIQRMPSRHASAIAADLGCDPAALESALSKMIAADLNDLSTPVVRA